MRLFELIGPSSRASLYAGTTIGNAENIVRLNKMIAATPIHAEKIPEHGKKSVSLSRSIRVAEKLAGGEQGNWFDIPVVLVFDGEALSRNLGKRMRPYDDTNTASFRANAERWGNPVPAGMTGRAANRAEAEEAIIGDITGVNQYITKIIIYYTPGVGHADLVTRIKQRVDTSPLLSDPRTIITDKPRAYYT